MQVVVSTSGRVITGLIIAESEKTLTVQTVNEKLVIPLDEIEMRSATSVSMMPEGQLQKLSTKQVRDLVAYLTSPTQVPLERSEDDE